MLFFFRSDFLSVPSLHPSPPACVFLGHDIRVLEGCRKHLDGERLALLDALDYDENVAF
jgi:hypothetical protein